MSDCWFWSVVRVALLIARAGGVSANSHIRKAIQDLADKYGVKLYVPPLSLCGDNAVMIASQGYYEYTVGKKTAGTNLNAYATMGIDEV
jgi:N6-L-threonylcarbamoyladenine synthase